MQRMERFARTSERMNMGLQLKTLCSELYKQAESARFEFPLRDQWMEDGIEVMGDPFAITREWERHNARLSFKMIEIASTRNEQ